LNQICALNYEYTCFPIETEVVLSINVLERNS